MGKGKTKDRTARWANMEHLLYQNQKTGLTIREMAEKCDVSTRQIYRDLKDLEQKRGMRFWQHDSRWGIAEGYFLPPVRFTLPEALNVFLAARLMLSYSHRYDPNVASTFIKLNSIVPSPLREQIQSTLDWMRELPLNEKRLRVMARLAEAWVSQRSARITYRSLPADKATERVIEPYFIQPAAPGHSSYVIARCQRAGELRVFKVERIEDIEVTGEAYTVPSDFDANRYLSSAWGIVAEGEIETVRLKFQPGIARLMEETVWHPSQVVESETDGSLVMTLRVFDTYEFRTWVLGWGEKVEVIEPPGLRDEIAAVAGAMAKVYRKRKP